MTTEERKARIRTFMARFVHRGELRDDEDIFARGLVNSLFAMQLVLFVEKEFRVAVDNDDLVLDNFRTVDAMSALVERKTASTAV